MALVGAARPHQFVTSRRPALHDFVTARRGTIHRRAK
jgi:hypothetical protein